MSDKKDSRFATVDEIQTEAFQNIIKEVCRLHRDFGLPDHGEINAARYPWSVGMQCEPNVRGPEVYAARLWEYPFCVLAAEFESGMVCADIGCGMSAFTLYMRYKSSPSSLGVDPDLFKHGVKHLGHGVSKDFLERTDLDIRLSTEELPSDHFDRVFCISVIEHVPRRKVHNMVRDMARILKPGGLLVMTVDVNIEYDMARPMDLIWESGLVLKRELDLAWPAHRLGRSENLQSSADVYGLVLEKPVSTINIDFSPVKQPAFEEQINQSQIPRMRAQLESAVPFPLRLRRYLKAEWFGR